MTLGAGGLLRWLEMMSGFMLHGWSSSLGAECTNGRNLAYLVYIFLVITGTIPICKLCRPAFFFTIMDLATEAQYKSVLQQKNEINATSISRIPR